MNKCNKLEQLKERFRCKQDIFNGVKNTVGEKLVELRKLYGYSQTEVADVVGITRVSLSNYEKAERTVDIEILYKLCSFYNVSIDYIVGIKKETSPEIEYEQLEQHKQVGLTDKALSILWGDEATSELFNDIIAHKDFKQLQYLTHQSRYTRYESMDTEYRSFLTSKLLYEMISDIYEQWYIDNDERIKTLSESEKIDLLNAIEQYKYEKKRANTLLMIDYEQFEEAEYQIDLLSKKLKQYF